MNSMLNENGLLEIENGSLFVSIIQLNCIFYFGVLSANIPFYIYKRAWHVNFCLLENKFLLSVDSMLRINWTST